MNICFASRVLVFLGMSCLSLTSWAAGRTVSVDADRLARWMIARSDSAPTAVRQKIREIEDSYEFVFIPGIMGSKLKIGNYEFGKGRVDPHALVLKDASIPAAAELMDQYSAFFTTFDVYKPGLVVLGVGTHGRRIKVFPYDWRLDLDITIDHFQDFATKELAGKRVIIFAHSTGALLAWHWKNSYLPPVDKDLDARKVSATKSRGERPFELAALVAIGAPFRGSCELARLLVEGYSAGPNMNEWEKAGIGLLFSGAQAAAFTFPSVYELLPTTPGCLRVKSGNSYVDQNLLRMGTWHNPGWSAIRKFAKDAGFADKPKEYEALVRKALNTAAQFRAKFDVRQHNDRVFFLYSQTFPMQDTYLAEAKDGWLRLNTGAFTLANRGDGRVTKQSAYPENDEGTIGVSWNLKNAHDALLSDEHFIQFLSDSLGRYIKEDLARLLAAEFLKDPTLTRELSTIGWVIPPGGTQYASSRATRDAQMTIAKYNASLVSDAEPADEVAALLKAAEQHRVQSPAMYMGSSSTEVNTIAALYESALILAPDRVPADKLVLLAQLKSANRKFDEALSHVNLAQTKLDNDTTATNRARGIVWAMRGSIYESTNATERASAAIAKARAYGVTPEPGANFPFWTGSDLQMQTPYNVRPQDFVVPDYERAPGRERPDLQRLK